MLQLCNHSKRCAPSIDMCLMCLPPWFSGGGRHGWFSGSALRISRIRVRAMPSATSWYEIVMIALVAMLCGAERLRRHGAVWAQQGAVAAPVPAAPGRDSEPRHLLADLPPARPGRVRGLLRPLSWRPSLGRRGSRAWSRSTARPRGAASTVRRGRRPLHLVSAWACEQRLVLGQQQVGDASNEIPALPELLALLGAGRLHRHRRRDALPEGHGAGDPRAGRRLRPGAEGQPAGAVRGRAPVARRSPTVAGRCCHDRRWRPRPHRDPPRHGRSTRSPGSPRRHGFPGLAAVAKVTAMREHDGKTTTATRYYLLSQPLARRPPRSPSCAATGRSRTASTGSSTWSWTRTARAPARTTPRKTSPGCAASPSTSCAPTATRARPAARSNAPAGTTLLLPSPRHPLMRSPC